MWDRIIGAQLASAAMVAGTQSGSTRDSLASFPILFHSMFLFLSSCSPNFQCSAAVMIIFLFTALDNGSVKILLAN